MTGAPRPLRGLRLEASQAVAFGVTLTRLLEATGQRLRTGNPALIVVAPDGSLRVLDDAVHGAPSADEVSWFSPELVRGLEPDERSDVFTASLAIIGVLMGRSPFLRDGAFDSLRAVIEGLWGEPLRSARPDVPGLLVAVLAHGVVPSIDARTPSIAALQAGLLKYTAPGEVEVEWRRFVASLFANAPALERPAAEPPTDEGRLVIADHLEEQGQHELARWLRVECHLHQASGDEREALRATLEQLSAELGSAAVAPFGRGPIERCRLSFGARCPGAWESLSETQAPAVRSCGACGRDVRWERSILDAEARVWDGGSVVVDPAVPRTPGDLIPPDRDQLT